MRHGRMGRARRMAENRPVRKKSNGMSARRAKAQRQREAVAPAPPTRRKTDRRGRPVATKRTASKFGVGSAKTVMHNGRRLANVSAEQLKKTGLTLRQYMNKWNSSGRRPS